MPYHDEQALNEDAEEWGEDTIGCCPPALPPLVAATDPQAQNPAAAPMLITDTDVMGMTVAILKAELRKRGQATSGTKSPLQKRLLDAIKNNLEVSECAVERDASMVGGLAHTLQFF